MNPNNWADRVDESEKINPGLFKVNVENNSVDNSIPCDTVTSISKSNPCDSMSKSNPSDSMSISNPLDNTKENVLGEIIKNDIIYKKSFTLGALSVFYFANHPAKACLMTLNSFVIIDCLEKDWKRKIITMISKLNITDLIIVGSETIDVPIRIIFDDFKYTRLLYPCKSCKSKSCVLRLAHEALKRYFKTYRFDIAH